MEKHTFETCSAVSDRYNERNDCAVKALSIACSVPYRLAHDTLAFFGRRNRRGTKRHMQREALELLAPRFSEEFVPRKPNGGGYTMKTIGKAYPRGRYLVYVSGHVAALIDGKLEDWSEGRQHRVKTMVKIEL